MFREVEGYSDITAISINSRGKDDSYGSHPPRTDPHGRVYARLL